MMRTKLWKIWLLGGMVAIALYFTVLPSIPHAVAIVYFLISAGAAVLVFAGVRIHRPQHPWTWYLLGGGMAAWAIGDGLWYAMETFGESLPYPSLADPFFLLAYPLFGAGLVLARRSRSQGSRSGAIIDASIVTVAASMLSWIVLMRPYLEDPAAPFLAKAVSISYPVGDLFILGVVVPMIGAGGRRNLSSRFLLSWLPLLLVTDTIYSVMVIHGTYEAGSWVDAGWLVGYLLLGAAALHPSMAAPAEGSEAIPARSLGRLRLGLIAVAALVGPALLLWIAGVERDFNAVFVISGGCVILAVLVIVRLTGLVRVAERRRQELDRATGELAHQALHDPLTGLANRTLFKDRLTHAGARSKRAGGALSLLLVDLDGFKEVNDSLGHAAGDDLLKEVGERLRDSLRSADTLARLGGDEFAILLEGDDLQGAIRVSESILQTMRSPFVIEGREIFIGASIGIALGDGEQDDLLRNADAAMYAAKMSGKNRYEIFEQKHQAGILERIELVAELRRAIEREEFTLRYQPIVALPTGRLVGVEALVRWAHPVRGELTPYHFISVAEQTGLILAIDRWVLREAVRQARTWHEAFPMDPPLGVSVNVSARQLNGERLAEQVEHTIREAGVDPATVTLEITESFLLDDTDAILAKLESLKEVGIRLSIDDFGTGYSSLSYLRRLPADEVKIDRSFVSGVASGAEEWTLARGIVRLIHSLGLVTVGEGIERAEQLAHMRALGCQLGQGYYFARPMLPEQITEILASTPSGEVPVIGPSRAAAESTRQGA
jgi:diguanylate cyclase (GGDEF)-like protein